MTSIKVDRTPARCYLSQRQGRTSRVGSSPRLPASARGRAGRGRPALPLARSEGPGLRAGGDPLADALLAMPLDRARESLPDRDLGLEAEKLACLRGVRDPIADVLVVPRQRVVRDEPRAEGLGDLELLLDRRRELGDRQQLRAADVDHLAARLRRLERPHEAFDGVVDVREAARLTSIDVDLHLLAVQERLDERDGRAAPAREVVLRAVRVEEAEDRRLEAAP